MTDHIRFNIGDRVRLNIHQCVIPFGNEGTVQERDTYPFVAWDNFTEGHDGDGSNGPDANNVFAVS